MVTESYGVNLSDLVGAGLLPAGGKIRARYKGADFVATVRPDGNLVLRGRLFVSLRRGGSPLSTAAGFAMSTVRQDPAGGKMPAADGWLFWKYVDANGHRRPLAELRRQFLGQRLDGTRI